MLKGNLKILKKGEGNEEIGKEKGCRKKDKEEEDNGNNGLMWKNLGCRKIISDR